MRLTIKNENSIAVFMSDFVLNANSQNERVIKVKTATEILAISLIKYVK